MSDRRFSILSNLLSGVLGVLIGFVVAYFMYETISPRQTTRLSAEQAVRQAAAGPGAETAPGAQTGQAAPGTAERRAAVAQTEGFLAANPDNPQAWLQLAQLSYDLEDWGRAVESYRRYLELAPADPNVLSELGVSLRGVGRTEEAIAAFDLAQEMAPQHWQSRYNEALVLAFDMGRFEDAEAVIEELRELQPDNPDVERLAAAVERGRDAT